MEEDWACLSKDSTYWGLLDTAKKTIALGDLLVKAGYSESDTIAQASRYYREALKYYMLPLTKFDQYFSTSPWAEDSILLLLLILGGDHRTVKDWSIKLGSDRLRRCYLPASDLDPEADWAVYDGDWDEDTIPKFKLAGYATNDITFQAIQLLGQLKLLNEFQNYTNCLEAYKETMGAAAIALGHTVSVEDVVNHIGTYLMGDVERQYRITSGDDGTVILDDAVKQITQKRELIHGACNVILSIEYHGVKHGQGKMPYLYNLASTKFKKDDAPNMFNGGNCPLRNYYTVPNTDGSMDPIPRNNKSPPELWMIMNDVFIETEGLKAVLIIMMDLSGKE